jgi:hypothetical protein
MKKILRYIAILIGLAGIIWFGQGIGVIHGSVMTDDSKWAVIGGIMIVVAAGTLWFLRKR